MLLSKKFYFLLLVFMLGIIRLSLAQLPADVNKITDEQLSKYLKQAEARGLSEAQVEAAALANGYSPTDIAILRERINRLKTGATGAAAATTTTGKVDKAQEKQNEAIERQQIGELAERTSTVVSEKQSVATQSNVFGKQLFSNKNLTFEPNLRLPTPKNYVLGPDDELKIDITGYAYQHYDAKISPEGTVKIENLAPIYVNGNTVEQAKAKIVERLKMLFAGLKTGALSADVTLGNVRTIKVTVVGEVETPGTYSLSSLATAFNALYLAGGPTENGSFRNIQVLRNNVVIKKIDLYDFLLRGVLDENVNLQDQDVIMVPIFDKKVEISGEVKRKAVFELRSNETFKDLLRFAGGFGELAYTASVNVNRNTSKERKIFTFDPSGEMSFGTQNGDKFVVGTILDRYENKVEIRGAVFRPGEYALGTKLKTLKQLIQLAEGLREDAFAQRIVIIREQENLDPVYLSIDLSKIMKGEAPDIDLKRQDQVVIKSLVEMRTERNVEIGGAVNLPGVYPYADNMGVRDLVLMAGGFADGASSQRVEVARRLYNNESVDKSVEIYTLNFENGLAITNDKFKLLPFDKVFIRILPNYEPQQLVKVQGEVNYPGTYAIESKIEHIDGILNRAGGTRPEAYMKGAQFFRKKKLVSVDFEKAIAETSSASNLLLEDGDSLYIPKVRQTIAIAGQVHSPTSVAYQPSFKFKDYISQAGGFTDSAFVKQTYVRYANGSTNRTASFLGIRAYPKVQPGMTVYVPTRHRQRMSPAEKISISSGLISLSAVLLTLIRLI